MKDKDYKINGTIKTISIAKKLAKVYNVPIVKIKKILDAEHSLTKEYICNGYAVNYEGLITFTPYVRTGYYRIDKNKKREYVSKVEMNYKVSKNTTFTTLIRKQPISMKKDGGTDVM